MVFTVWGICDPNVELIVAPFLIIGNAQVYSRAEANRTERYGS